VKRYAVRFADLEPIFVKAHDRYEAIRKAYSKLRMWAPDKAEGVSPWDGWVSIPEQQRYQAR
jgi:hypothetical protein